MPTNNKKHSISCALSHFYSCKSTLNDHFRKPALSSDIGKSSAAAFDLIKFEEQVRSGDASATEYFELGALMLKREFYPAATKYLLQVIEKWDGDDQELAQVYNTLGASYIRDGKIEKGIGQFENAVKLQPGYVTAWNNLGVLLFDPINKVARPRRDALKEKVQVYKGVPLKTKQRSLRIMEIWAFGLLAVAVWSLFGVFLC